MTPAITVSGVPRDAEVVTFPPKVGSRIRLALVPSTLVVSVAVLGVREPHEWVAWLLLVGQLPMAVIRWLAVREARRQPWALRIEVESVHHSAGLHFP